MEAGSNAYAQAAKEAGNTSVLIRVLYRNRTSRCNYKWGFFRLIYMIGGWAVQQFLTACSH
jgi:hypothetical protein